MKYCLIAEMEEEVGNECPNVLFKTDRRKKSDFLLLLLFYCPLAVNLAIKSESVTVVCLFNV